MGNNILWQMLSVNDTLEIMSQLILEMEEKFSAINSIQITNSSGGAIPNIERLNYELKRNVRSRVNYMRTMVQMINTKKDEIAAIDNNSF